MSSSTTEPSRAELEMAHCWEQVDRVPGRVDQTAYKRRLRYRQAAWRTREGHPEGHQRTRAGGRRLLGSRIDLEYAVATGANFLSDSARAAVADRLAHPEAHQTLNTERLWRAMT